MKREYIKIKKPYPLPCHLPLLRKVDDKVWKQIILYHLLIFYQHHDVGELKSIVALERTETYPRTERTIARYIRRYLRNNVEFDSHFNVIGESTNDEDIEGNYDIVIINTYWENKFHFECKNLKDKGVLINKYVYCDIYKKDKTKKKDGGVYRYFNGKYAQSQDFGGMIGFILSGDVTTIKKKIIDKLKMPFDISPEGDLKRTIDNSIDGNEFTFSTIHSRYEKEFTIDHLLFDLQLV